MRVVAVGRKPLSESSVAANVLKHGVGALNIDGCRIGVFQNTQPSGMDRFNARAAELGYRPDAYAQGVPPVSKAVGRWPTNLVLDHPASCRHLGTKKLRTYDVPHAKNVRGTGGAGGQNVYESYAPIPDKVYGFADENGEETLDLWECDPGCPVGDTDHQSEGTSRYFPQVQTRQESTMSSSEIPKDLLDYLHTMITPSHVGGETLLALDIDAIDWTAIEDDTYHGLIAQGTPSEEQVEQMWRVVKPGAHVMLIAPEDCPTGHKGACALEDRGFEIRDAILWVREAGRIHYVPKANTRERNAGCEALAQKRQGPPSYILPEDLDEEILNEIQEALLDAGLEEDVVNNLHENGIPKELIPAAHATYFRKRKSSAKYGNNHPCLHPDALVMTDRGYRPIQEIKEGDRVYSADGRFHTVTWASRHPYTSPSLYEIAVRGTNLTTLASDNHPFLVWRPERDKKGNIKGGQVQWLPAAEIVKGDYTLTPILTERINMPDDIPGDLDFWFIFGLYLAGGVLQKAGHGYNLYPSFTLNVNEQHLIDRIKGYFEPRGCNVSVYPKPGTDKAVQVVASCPETGDLFRILGGTGAATKSINPLVWRIGRDHQSSLLDGYFEGDGGHARTYRQAKTVSRDLASQIRLIGEGLGYKANLHRFVANHLGGIGERQIKSQQPEHQIRLYGRNQEIDGRKPSRPTYIEHDGHTYMMRYVKDVAQVEYTGDVVNLSVEGSPTFQTATGMSHNTVKPKDVLQRLLSDVPEGATVLDPFMGSGSMGLACLETGHSYIGIEREEEYIEIADARVRHWDRARLRRHHATIESEAPRDDEGPAEMGLDDFLDL